ncbi:SIS domain-containing protein [Micromonospora sp. C95]|uniref:SIS domain-containing protein n=1 Tax=Micromonospora sp. C95 TaxID=2824882 RepID=UPI001B36939F|nr:SIS domain-containing protein [Micromonospora sp. C95]MBQ1026033.1 SIS domain-containing protein [Micromonospora sp. C95]
MATDISEQPEAFARLVAPGSAARIAEVAAVVAARRPRHVMLTARGTSDHAALYGAYLAEIRLALPAGLGSPSTVTLFGTQADYSKALVIGVSQSGRSPDLCELVKAARKSGATTVAITNEPDSLLAQNAELVIHLDAGVERALPATKTYTTELLALLMLIEGVRAGDGRLPEPEASFLATLPELAARLLEDDGAEPIASRLRFVDSLVITGRGYGYPTAREAAHKIMETSYLPALAYSGADLLHGPLAVTAPRVPVLAVVGQGPGGVAMSEVVARLAARQSEVTVVSSTDVAGAHDRLHVPGVDERYSPLLDILPLQRLTLALAVTRGNNPDAPEGITKVTPTR